MTPADVAARLVRAEERLRADGLTGARAFDALLAAIRAGLDPTLDAGDVPASVRDLVRELPEGVDLLGLAYERFFSDLFKGKRGQYFTPRPLVELLLARAEVGPGDVVLDPTCGSGGFLVVAGRRGATVRGFELDPQLAALAGLNLRLAGVAGHVDVADFFRAEPDPVDVVVANPPFSVAVTDPDVLARYTLGRGRARAASEALFVEALGRWVRPGGRAAVVLPFSVLNSPTTAPLRELLDDSFVKTSIMALPEGVFRPFGGAAGRACLLWLRRRPAPTTALAWANLADPGYDVRSQRYRATSAEEIDGLLAGSGWSTLPANAWTPVTSGLLGGRPLAELAVAVDRSILPSRSPNQGFAAVDLADTDKSTGEAFPRSVAGADLVGPRATFSAGDVLVARMRPELGNVAIAPASTSPLVGSPEWLVLRAPRLRFWLLHALRTPAWRAQLPVTEGQTRPRVRAEAVLASAVPWPGDAVAERIDAVSARLHAERARLRDELEALQAAIDAFAAGEVTAEELLERVNPTDGNRTR